MGTEQRKLGMLRSSDQAEHCLECHGHFKWINHKTLSTEQQCHRQKERESLEIKKGKTNKRRKVLNNNEANLVKRNAWTLLEKEINAKT